MRYLPLLLIGLLVGCQGSGDFSIFGYSTVPPFDPNIRTIYIPVFKNTAFHTSPYRGIEADLTEAIIRELNNRRTPMRVVSDISQADTELVGTIIQIDKMIHNRTRENLNREFEVFLAADVVWRDLRTGRVLSSTRQENPDQQNPNPFDPSIAPPPEKPGAILASPTRLIATGRVLPELGESNATGSQAAVQMMARQIVNMMEQPWTAPPRPR